MAQTTGICFGKTGTFKTANLGFLAKYIYEKTHKPIRYVSADGGGWRPIQGLIDIGIIHPLSIINDDRALFLMRKIIADRLWPLDINEHGERTSGKVIDNMNEYGGVIFEGVTSISECLISAYRGKQTGMKPAHSEVVKSGEFVDDKGKALDNEVLGGYAMDSYGLIQEEVSQLILKSWSLPVDTVFWSGHEVQAEDDLTKKQIRGLALVGNAATPRIGKKCGMMIHAYQVPIELAKGEKGLETRYYFQSHADVNFNNIQWESKCRVPAEQVEKLLKKYPGGYFVPTLKGGLDEYLRYEDMLLSENVEELQKWKQSIDDNAKNVKNVKKEKGD